MRTGTASERGFTLVEVMVALLVFGMLAAAGVAILSFSVRAQGATAAKLDDIAALTRASSILAADFGQAVPRRTRGEDGTAAPAFSGGPDAVMLVRGGWSNPDAAPRPGIQKVAYRLSGDTLERVSWPMPDGAAPLPPAALVTGVARLRFRYRFGGAWSDRWDGVAAGTNAPALPRAAELVIARRDGTTVRQMFLVGTGVAGPAVVVGAPG